ncbi:PAS domain S-box protein [Metabacillus herbersteinensis]|uniref:histidine kinase n=1 Tax=Metabacillus herbersteinensis TaxID=283816 RepID=A0ABV6GAI8_9BACI
MFHKTDNGEKQSVEIDMYAVISSNGRFQYISSNSIEYLGFTNTELIGKYFKDYIHTEELFLVESYFYNEHHLYPCSFRFQSKSGAYIWLETTVDFIKNKINKEEQEVILKMKTCDVPNIQREKDDFFVNEPIEQFKFSSIEYDASHLIEDLPCPVFISISGKVRYANTAFKELIGAESEYELIGKHSYEFVNEDYHDILKNRIQRMQNGSHVGMIEQTWKRLDGSTFDVEVKSAPTTYNGEKAELVALIDISSRKKFQKILQKSRERYQRLIQNSIDTIAVIHQDKWVFMNESGIKLFVALDYPDMLGKNIYGLLDSKDHDRMKESLRKVLSGQSEVEITKQTWFTSEDKRIFTEMVCIPTTYFGDPAVQVILRNISDRKRAEELMIQSEKLSVAGQLAAGIAHEIRNPLTAIKGFLQIMQPEREEKGHYFEIIFSELNRIELILSELLMLAKPQEIMFKTANIISLLQDVATLLETQANLNNILVEQQHEESELLVNCDQNQIKQVFINFVKNAIDAMPKGGKVTISSKKEQNSVKIIVKDEGEGIPEELLKRIGEPFLTTKENGTGLGLMITYNIIENHNGTVQVHSEVGKGTTFTVLFPCI